LIVTLERFLRSDGAAAATAAIEDSELLLSCLSLGNKRLPSLFVSPGVIVVECFLESVLRIGKKGNLIEIDQDRTSRQNGRGF
jgi:hypothetical protein